MLRKIHWGDLSVPFVFACMMLAVHYKWYWFEIGYGMLVLSFILSIIRPFKDDVFLFPSSVLHYLWMIGIVGFLDIFFPLWLSVVFSLLVIWLIEYIQGFKQDIDTVLDILAGILGILTFIFLNKVF